MPGYLAEFKADWKKRELGAEIRTSTACPPVPETRTQRCCVSPNHLEL